MAVAVLVDHTDVARPALRQRRDVVHAALADVAIGLDVFCNLVQCQTCANGVGVEESAMAVRMRFMSKVPLNEIGLKI